ncbi:hypothetical protein BS50DRAFT_312297 [Corynespora cassiicola Philippines]|uniref:Uncharacterized protein n=1 Tax=Corynespora cassiicola Philippines TaxID=1448308 RepID=A0A2T2NYC5_CORCC|nr:hypothetical protein BS50DRAFT_312297 [Corynespora cassiicola Philippines]
MAKPMLTSLASTSACVERFCLSVVACCALQGVHESEREKCPCPPRIAPILHFDQSCIVANPAVLVAAWWHCRLHLSSPRSFPGAYHSRLSTSPSSAHHADILEATNHLQLPPCQGHCRNLGGAQFYCHCRTVSSYRASEALATPCRRSDLHRTNTKSNAKYRLAFRTLYIPLAGHLAFTGATRAEGFRLS